MKTIQSLGWYFPDSTGGSEVYVAGLVRELRALGIDSRVTAPREGNSESHETVEQTAVYRYPVPMNRTRAQHEGLVPHDDFELFSRWLQQQDAAVYHQHSLTYGCGLNHLQAAKAAGMKTVLTIHTPGVLCLRDTLLHAGTSVCDGRIDLRRCASCWLQSRGLAPLASEALALVPPALASALRPLGRAGSALAATALARDHRADLHRAFELAERVVVVCQWLHDALLRNEVPRHKLILSRQGVALPAVRGTRERVAGGPLVVGFLGRGDPVKGVAVLVEALRLLPADVKVELQLHVVESNEPHARAYMDRARARALHDSRINFCPPLPPQAVPAFLAGIDVLAVPSQWLETGPLVVLEALAAGVPVIGSDLGGISELVGNRDTGLLVKHDDPAAWAAALQLACDDPALLNELRNNIGPVRTMAAAAHDMHTLYADLLA